MSDDYKLCPYCGEEIKIDAIKCKHCHMGIKEENGGGPKIGVPEKAHVSCTERAPKIQHSVKNTGKSLWQRWWVWAAAVAVLFFIFTSGGSDDPPAAEIDAAGENQADVAPESAVKESLEVETAPATIPEPMKYSGNGDDVIKITLPEEGPVMLYIKGNAAARHFAVLGYDENDNRTELFVNTANPYEGLTLDPTGTTALLEISASGAWEVETRSVRSARTLVAPGSISGAGDEVLLVEGDASTATINGNPNERHFAVIGYHDSLRNLMVNTADVYEGTVRVSRGTFLLEISAVGAWEITLE